MLIQLKQALSIHNKPAYRVARDVGHCPSWMSMVIQGMVEPSDEEKRRIAEELDRTVGELFPPQATEVA